MNLGIGELIVIFLIVVLVFGANKIPQLGDAIGKGIKNFKRAVGGHDEIDVTPKKEIPPERKPPADPKST